MPSILELALLLGALGSGLVAGLCFAFASFLMRAFDDLGAPAAIRVMQSLNARILRSGAMVVWLGTAVIGVAAAVLAGGAPWVVAAAFLYAVGAIAITGRGNVPLNERLDEVDPDAPGASEAWRRYFVAWGRWNAVRTAVCAAASACFTVALASGPM